MITETLKELLKGNWELDSNCYAPARFKTTTGRIYLYPYAMNPEDENEVRFMYFDQDGLLVMQGSWAELLNMISAHGFTLERDYEYFPQQVTRVINANK